jgi:2-dehydropantoate 2-reductase
MEELRPASDPAVIAVVGTGAVGQFYAAQLIWAGHDVRLLARRDARVLAERGLLIHQTPTPNIRSSGQHPQLRLAPNRFLVATDPQRLVERGKPDWVLVALKATALEQARALVEPLVGPQTRIVILCNGLGIEDQFADWFGAEKIFGLLCFIGVNRDDDGTIHHKAFGHVAVGHFQDNRKESEQLVQLFESAGVACADTQSLLEARWRKLGWNLPFNGLCLLYDCTTDAIVNNEERRTFALRLAAEAVLIGNLDLAAHGQAVSIEEGWAQLQLSRTDTMGAYAPSTLLDARAGRPQEIDMMFLEPARRAKRLGALTPALCRLLEALNSRGLL